VCVCVCVCVCMSSCCPKTGTCACGILFGCQIGSRVQIGYVRPPNVTLSIKVIKQTLTKNESLLCICKRFSQQPLSPSAVHLSFFRNPQSLSPSLPLSLSLSLARARSRSLSLSLLANPLRVEVAKLNT